MRSVAACAAATEAPTTETRTVMGSVSFTGFFSYSHVVSRAAREVERVGDGVVRPSGRLRTIVSELAAPPLGAATPMRGHEAAKTSESESAICAQVIKGL